MCEFTNHQSHPGGMGWNTENGDKKEFTNHQSHPGGMGWNTENGDKKEFTNHQSHPGGMGWNTENGDKKEFTNHQSRTHAPPTRERRSREEVSVVPGWVGILRTMIKRVYEPVNLFLRWLVQY
jgi:hypothetical protein